MGKKRRIVKGWKKEFDAISEAERKTLGITRSNFRVEYSKELDYVRRHK